MADLNKQSIEDQIENLKNEIKTYEDFPKPGIAFKDFFPIFQNTQSLHTLIKLLVKHIKTNCPEVEAIYGLESRGFLFGPLLAYELNLPFLPIRKSGKLPGKVIKKSYELEYGKDELEIQLDAVGNLKKCVIVDDLLATGGTLAAANLLLKSCKLDVLQNIVIIELKGLKAKEQLEKNGVEVFSLIKID